MNETLKFNAKYGILKKNLFGKQSNKLKKVLDVETIINFTNEYIEIYLYGIDRDDGTGIHNEVNVFLYENIEKIELLEDSNAFNIITKPNTEYIDVNTNKKILESQNNIYFISNDKVKDLLLIIKRLQNYGFTDLKQE